MSLSQNIGSKHNVTARPFGAGDAVSPGTATVVHKQFNSPAGLYSASNIAETFKGQTEGLIAGHMLEGEEEPQAVSSPGVQSRSFKMLQQHIGDEVDGNVQHAHTVNVPSSTDPTAYSSNSTVETDKLKYPSYFKRIEAPFASIVGVAGFNRQSK
ncbi:PDZ and LIM domain protein 3-like [Anneissia japonica]|uniref:PDZ and LIM domain protein 3-like n=1 Tax=Anneissia japonica TaxID=1529436 RepID=UPI001425603D|nr:PDZ and LIM domain protein 3-like [Anneissia japonica]